MKKLSTALAALALPVLLAGPMALSSSAADHTELMATLTELNDSGGSGTVWAKVTGNEVWLSMEVAGLLDGAPHAQHIHIGGDECPTTEWADSPLALERVRSEGLAGPDALHGWFLGEISGFLLANGRTPVCWDEGGGAADLPFHVIVTC